jgi:hypothetical protein
MIDTQFASIRSLLPIPLQYAPFFKMTTLADRIGVAQ